MESTANDRARARKILAVADLRSTELPPAAPGPRGYAAGTVQARAVDVVRGASRPMTPAAVHAQVVADGGDPEVSVGAVHKALARAVDDGQLKKSGRGLYEPLPEGEQQPEE